MCVNVLGYDYFARKSAHVMYMSIYKLMVSQSVIIIFDHYNMFNEH